MASTAAIKCRCLKQVPESRKNLTVHYFINVTDAPTGLSRLLSGNVLPLPCFVSVAVSTTESFSGGRAQSGASSYCNKLSYYFALISVLSSLNRNLVFSWIGV